MSKWTWSVGYDVLLLLQAEHTTNANETCKNILKEMKQGMIKYFMHINSQYN